MENEIPPITDRMGIGWRQPARENVLIDDTHALMSAQDAALLYKYDYSCPSGVYEGKMWQYRDNLCWYAWNPGSVGFTVKIRRLLIV
jgi:hypothetical protein